MNKISYYDILIKLHLLFESKSKEIKDYHRFIDEAGDTTLTLLSKRSDTANVIIYTKNISKALQLDIEKFNSQYAPIEIKELKSSHDRFLIIDSTTMYHIGASLKDLGKKWFAFSKMNSESLEVLAKLKQLST